MSCTTCTTNGSLPKGCKNNGACGVDGCGKLTVFDWLADVKLPSSQTPYNIIEVQFKNDRKEYCENTENLAIQIGDLVTINANPGYDVGKVTLTGELVKTQQRIKKVRKDAILSIIRKSTEKDIDSWVLYREKEEDTKIQARKMAFRLNLAMKISDVEYQADGKKVTLYYTAEGRVDFRQLIKDYAGTFRTKIDMRQIGYRQESAKVGGIGSCGRELCCSTWLTDFRSVNTAAARYQQLSINPQKLAGQCGKLKCCLNYELDSYLDALSDFPSQNTSLMTEKGKANCIKIDVFRKKMSFLYQDNSFQWFEFSTTEVKEFIEENKKGNKLPPLEELMVEDIKVVEVDIIQENSLDRFERKNKRKRKPNSKRKPNNRKPNNNPNRNKNNSNKNTNRKPQNTKQATKPKSGSKPKPKGNPNNRKPNPPKK